LQKNERLKPNKQFLEHLHRFSYHCYHLNKTNYKLSRIEGFQVAYEKFKVKLKKWKQFMGLDKILDDAVKTVEEHPWEQYQSVEATGMEEIKNPKQRREKKRSRHIQRLTPKKLGVESVDSLLTAK